MKMIYRDVIQGDEYRVYELTPEEVQWQNDKDRGMFRRAILRNTMKRLVRKILFFFFFRQKKNTRFIRV